MKLGMMTSAFSRKTPYDVCTSYVGQVRLCKKAGYDVLDCNMCKMIENETELNRDDWEKRTEDIREEAEKLGLTFYQSHPPFSHVIGGGPYPDQEMDDFCMEMTKRSILISSMLGVKWAVLHPMTVKGEMAMDRKANIEANHARFDDVVELALRHGVGIAFENMRDREEMRRFSVDPAELVEFVDSYGTDQVGICWDTGHANQRLVDQRRALRLIGKRLHVMHVNDNHGGRDEHLLPFMGTVDWRQVMAALHEIGFEGPLVYELSVTDYMPLDMKVETMRFARTIGKTLLDLANHTVAE